jgi:hypothetical protein
MRALGRRANRRYIDHVRKLLDQGIQAIRELPAERQDLAGELLLTLAAGELQYQLTPEQIEDLKLAVQEADRGDFAAAGQIADTWKKFGL